MNVRIRTTIAAAATAALLTLGCGLSDPGSGTSGGVQVEDCDAEDFRNREDDCGFTDSDRRKTAKPTPKKTAAKVPSGPGKPRR